MLLPIAELDEISALVALFRPTAAVFLVLLDALERLLKMTKLANDLPLWAFVLLERKILITKIPTIRKFLSNLMIFHVSLRNGFVTHLTRHVGVELLVMFFHARFWNGFVADLAKDDIPGAMQSVHHISFGRNIPLAGSENRD